jgi:hypothetical protein
MTYMLTMIASARAVLARLSRLTTAACRAALDLMAAGGTLLAFLLPDLLALGGAAAVAYGARLVYLPAGYIVGGILALALGWMGIRARASDGKAGE